MSDVQAADVSAVELRQMRLGDATVQDIQLELIRRHRFHKFDGQRVVQCLLENRNLWEAVAMDRVAISHPGCLPSLGLMKLRDLSAGQWNVDTLYILTPTKEAAEQLATIFRLHRWGGMVSVHSAPREVDDALGGAKAGQAIVAIWWD